MKLPKSSLLIAFTLYLPGVGVAAEEVRVCPLRTQIFRIPPGFIGDGGSEPSGSASEPSPAQRLKAMDYLKEAGIEFPPGGEAQFEPLRSRLTVRATDEVIEKVRALVERTINSGPRQVRFVFGVAEFTTAKTEALQGLTYDGARALASDTWRVLERTSLIAHSGQKSSCLYSIAPEAPPARAKETRANAAPHWRNEKFEFEPQVGPDETSIEVGFRFQRRQTAGQSPKQIDAGEKVVLKNDAPALVRATALPATKGSQSTTVRALIVRATIVDPYGVRAPPAPEKPLPHHP